MIDYVEIYVGEIYAENFLGHTKSVPFRPVITWRLVYCTNKIYSSITKMLPELSNHTPVHNGAPLPYNDESTVQREEIKSPGPRFYSSPANPVPA